MTPKRENATSWRAGSKPWVSTSAVSKVTARPGSAAACSRASASGV
jgi:hypothetical protein